MTKIYKVKVRDIPVNTRASTAEHTDIFYGRMKDETEVEEMEGCPNWFVGIHGDSYNYHRDWLVFEKEEECIK